MSINVIGLSREEAALLTVLASTGKDIFTIEDAYAHWHDDPNTAFRLRDLEAKGWLERLERGKYLIIPLEAGPAREWSEDAFVVAMHLVDPAAIAYWSALHHWNLTEQVPRITYVQTTSRKFKRETEALGVRFRFVTVTERKFFGFERQHVDHKRYVVTDREKTLLDALDRPELSGGVPQLVDALRSHAPAFDWARVDGYLERFGSGAVAKRLGFLVDAMELEIPDRGEHLARWAGLLSAGLAMLDPSNARKPHRIATRWRIRVNVDEVLLQSAT